MSVYWARNVDNRVVANEYGFYDTHGQIVVIPSRDILPSVVVDHELTHVNLVENTALGLLEQLLRCIEWVAVTDHNKEAEAKMQAPISVILSACEIVHEAVAWFGTELQTGGSENFKAPPRYEEDVKRIWRWARHLRCFTRRKVLSS